MRDSISMATVATGGGGIPTAGRDLGPSISAVHQNLHPSLHPSIHQGPLSSRVAPSAGTSSSAHNNASGGLPEVPPIAKRPRMEMGGPIHHQGVQPPTHTQPSQHASRGQSGTSMTPLRIDTREAAKVKLSCSYFPMLKDEKK